MCGLLVVCSRSGAVGAKQLVHQREQEKIGKIQWRKRTWSGSWHGPTTTEIQNNGFDECMPVPLAVKVMRI